MNPTYPLNPGTKRPRRHRHRIRPVSPCLLLTMPGSSNASGIPPLPLASETSPAPPAAFPVPRTPPPKLDAARIAHELGTIPPLLSPLPITPESVPPLRPGTPPLSSMDWLELDTSPILTTPDRAPTPSPTRRPKVSTLLHRMGPAPSLHPSGTKPTLEGQYESLFGSTSPPTPNDGPLVTLPPPAETPDEERALVSIPLQSLRPSHCPPNKRYRLFIPGKADKPPRWVTIPPQGRNDTKLIIVPMGTIIDQAKRSHA